MPIYDQGSPPPKRPHRELRTGQHRPAKVCRWVENRQLGAARAFIRDQQLHRKPEPRSDRAPRRRDPHNARLFKVVEPFYEPAC